MLDIFWYPIKQVPTPIACFLFFKELNRRLFSEKDPSLIYFSAGSFCRDVPLYDLTWRSSRFPSGSLYRSAGWPDQLDRGGVLYVPLMLMQALVRQLFEEFFTASSKLVLAAQEARILRQQFRFWYRKVIKILTFYSLGSPAPALRFLRRKTACSGPLAA